MPILRSAQPWVAAHDSAHARQALARFQRLVSPPPPPGAAGTPLDGGRLCPLVRGPTSLRRHPSGCPGHRQGACAGRSSDARPRPHRDPDASPDRGTGWNPRRPVGPVPGPRLRPSGRAQAGHGQDVPPRRTRVGSEDRKATDPRRRDVTAPGSPPAPPIMTRNFGRVHRWSACGRFSPRDVAQPAIVPEVWTG